ncbi:MAG: hypothetical protein ACP5P4_00170 [Steroidobacteraceae bacterium]
MSKSSSKIRWAAWSATSLALVLIAGCAPQTPLLNQSLTWTPTHQLHLGVTPTIGALATVRFEPFTDRAAHPRLVGENVEQSKPRLVTTVSSVSQFVSQHLQHLFAQAGYTAAGANADRVISGQVRKFFVREHNLYRASVVLTLTVRNRSGALLWQGTVWARNSTFGRSYQLYNYNQVLSDSVVSVANQLLANASLRKALMLH